MKHRKWETMGLEITRDSEIFLLLPVIAWGWRPYILAFGWLWWCWSVERAK